MKMNWRFVSAITYIFLQALTVAANTAEDIDATAGMVTDSSKVYNLDELVVVAQAKENALLREQPVAASIFTSDGLKNLWTRDMRDLALFVPSLQMPAYGSRLTSAIYIRGIGSRINNPAVGMYCDGVPLLSKSAYNFHIYQTDRIDVLRGPQGTLYGMNTEGGLIRMYSKNPLTHKGNDIKLGIGSHMYRNAELATYNRLGEWLGISVAAYYSGRDGCFKNTTTGKRADRHDEAGGKLRLSGEWKKGLALDLTADYQYVNQGGFAYGVYDPESGYTQSPASNRQGGYKRNMLNAALNVRRTFRWVTLNSTTSYQFLADDMRMDQDYTPLDYMHLRQKQLQNALTEELALKGNNNHGWKHTSGIFGSYQWHRTEAPVFFDQEFTTSMGNTIEGAMYDAIQRSIAKRFPDLSEEQALNMAAKVIERAGGVRVTDVEMLVPGLFRTPQLNLGIFHESAVNFSPQLTLTLGLRYDYNRVKVDYKTSALMSVGVNVMGVAASSTLRSILENTNRNSFSQVLPKAGLTWRISPDGSNIYAIVSKGYRSGGYNIQMFSDILQTELRNNSTQAMRSDYDVEHSAEDYERINSTIAYKPEESWNYEIGAHLNLWGNTIHADLAAYYMKIRNQQLSVMAGTYGFGRMMVNAGRSHSCGVEAALRGMALCNHLSWQLSYSLINSVFDKYTDEENDYEGNSVPFIPRHSISGAVNWQTDIKRGYIESVVFGLNATAQGKTYWDEANTYSEPFYALLGAHIDLNLRRSVKVSLWGRNLTDTRYNTFAFSSSATGTELHFGQRGNPLQVGIDLDFHF